METKKTTQKINKKYYVMMLVGTPLMVVFAFQVGIGPFVNGFSLSDPLRIAFIAFWFYATIKA